MIAPIVCRGFGSFGSVNLVVTRGYGIGTSVGIPGPYYFVTAVLYAAGTSAGLIYGAGVSRGSVYGAGASAGQITTE